MSLFVEREANSSPKAVKADYQSAVETQLNTSNFKILDYDLVPLTESGIGFFGVYSKLSVRVQTSSGNVSELKYFVKGMPSDQVLIDFIHKDRFWVREPLMYLDVLKKLQPLVEYKLSAKCYLARPDELVILEDLVAAGYRNNRQEWMDLDHCRVALECLANFHSASIIFEEKNNVRLDQLHPDVISVPEIVATPNAYQQLSCNTATTLQKLYDSSLLTVTQEGLENIKSFIRQWPNLFKPKTEMRRVVCHRDPWNNNFMFTYDEEGSVLKACMIDFQTSSYLPPGFDIMMVLHLNTTRQFRSEHQEQLLDHYYQHLTTQLTGAELDRDQLFSPAQFTASCQHALPVALVTTLIYWMMVVKLPPASLGSIMVSSESFVSYMSQDSKDIVVNAFKEDEEFQRLVTDCLQEITTFLYKGNKQDTN